MDEIEVYKKKMSFEISHLIFLLTFRFFLGTRNVSSNLA